MGKKFRGLALSLVGAAVLAVPASVLGAAPAMAERAPGYDRCPENHYCIFSGPQGTGEMFSTRTDAPDLGALTRRGQSDWNRTEETARLYTETDFGGCSVVTIAGDKGGFADKYRNQLSSVKLGGPGGPACP